jgi:hypothetical protein
MRYLAQGKPYQLERRDDGTMVMVSEIDDGVLPVTQHDLDSYGFIKGTAGIVQKKCSAFIGVKWEKTEHYNCDSLERLGDHP